MRSMMRADIARSEPPPSRGARLLSEFSAASYNPATHTVEAVLSTGARVKRFSFQEELAIAPNAIDLARAVAGQVKLLDTHNQYSLDAVLGTVSNVRISGGKLLGTLTFDQSERGIAAEGQVSRGIVTGVSIGYSVRNWALVDQGDDSLDVWRADSWELIEVSLVSVPADAGAGTRALSETETSISPEGDDMLTRNQPAGGAPANPAPANIFTAAEAVDFIDMARDFGVEDAARRMVSDNIPPAAARQQIMAAASARQRAATSHIGAGGHTAGLTPAGTGARAGDPQETIRQGMEDALFSRMTRRAPSEQGRQFRSMSMVDMMRYNMRQRGERNVDFLPPAEVVRMHTTGDFPMLLNSAGNRALMSAFQAAPNPLKELCRRSTIDDFRAKYSIKLGNFPKLPLVIEGGEITRGSTSESYENYKLGTYGQIFSLSRQAIINDDLDAFGDWQGRMAQASAETEAALLVGLLTQASGVGPTLTDGKALFHTDHGNLAGSGTLIDVTNLSAARLAMRSQKGLDGVTLAPVTPKTLLVGATKETQAEQIVASITAASSANVNPFAGKLSVAVEPRLAGNVWYLFADPALSPVLEYSYLTGAEGPQMDVREGWDVLGAEFRVTLDFGCGAVDFRGAYRNAGA